MQITKGRVLEVFTQQFQKLTTQDKQRRAAEAYNASIQILAPWRKGMSSSGRDTRWLVSGYLDEILKDDYGVTPVDTKPMSDIQTAGSCEGRKAAEEFLKTDSHLVTPTPSAKEASNRWVLSQYDRGLEWVPKGRMADKEWTSGFLMGFAGVIWRYQRNLPV